MANSSIFTSIKKLCYRLLETMCLVANACTIHLITTVHVPQCTTSHVHTFLYSSKRHVATIDK